MSDEKTYKAKLLPVGVDLQSSLVQQWRVVGPGKGFQAHDGYHDHDHNYLTEREAVIAAEIANRAYAAGYDQCAEDIKKILRA